MTRECGKLSREVDTYASHKFVCQATLLLLLLRYYITKLKSKKHESMIKCNY
jgi:hypothetical protein